VKARSATGGGGRKSAATAIIPRRNKKRGPISVNVYRLGQKGVQAMAGKGQRGGRGRDENAEGEVQEPGDIIDH